MDDGGGGGVGGSRVNGWLVGTLIQWGSQMERASLVEWNPENGLRVTLLFYSWAWFFYIDAQFSGWPGTHIKLNSEH